LEVDYSKIGDSQTEKESDIQNFKEMRSHSTVDVPQQNGEDKWCRQEFEVLVKNEDLVNGKAERKL
jgi:hypothetical protein